MGKGNFYAKGYYAGLAPEPRFDKVLKIASRLKCERLLDIGCGDGTFTILLKESLKAKEVAGIEISQEAIAAAKEKGITAYHLDIDKSPFPFANDYFDVVYCGEIIEHVFDTDHLLNEVHRILKPDGIAILTTPNLAGWPNRLALLLGYQPFPTAVSPLHEGVGKLFFKGDEGQWGHIRVFTVRALNELLRIHHLSIMRIVGCPISFKTPSSNTTTKVIQMLDRTLSRISSLSNRVVVVVKKE